MILLALILLAAVSMCAGWWLREWELRADRPPRVVERTVVRRVEPPVDCEREGWV